jgi:DNA-binding IclR family transcriptional regulator
LLATLERLDVVERDGPYRQYRLGRRIRALTGETRGSRDLRQIALPYMEELRDQTEETVTLHVLDGTEHVVIEQVESFHEIRRSLPIGQRIPLLKGATARALLGFLPTEQAESILAQTRTPDASGPTCQELQEIRQHGFAYSPAERLPGGSAISAPIRDQAGRVFAALSVSGPAFRFTAARAVRFAPALVAAANGIANRKSEE